MSINRLAAAAMAFVIGGLSGCGEREAKRLPPTGFKVAFESHKVGAQMKSGEKVAADVTVKNDSPVSWPSNPNSKNLHAVNLAYHWLDKKGQMVVFDGARTPLPYDLKPGESVTLKAAIHPPERPGAYILEITLVQEGVAWFPENGGAKLSLPVDVTRAITADAPGSNAGAAKKRGAQVAEKDASQALWLPRAISSRVSADDTMDRRPFKSFLLG